MSISWYITPYDPKEWEDPNKLGEKSSSDLEVNPTELFHVLESHWTKDVFIEDSAKTFPPYVVQDQDGSTLRIYLYHQHQIIELDNTPGEYFFDFILLYRAFIPETYTLYFFNSSAWDSLELKLRTTIQEIKQFMNYKVS